MAPSEPDSAPPFRPRSTKTSTRDYQPSYDFGGDRVSGDHGRAEELVEDVPGWLRPEDALKLYELAYYARGPILEIGTYRGKSGTLMAIATRDAGRSALVVSVDVDPQALTAAAAAAAAKGVRDRLLLVRGSVEALFAANRTFRPSLVFLDADHSYEAVRRDLSTLEPHVPHGGLLLLHDFLDPRNDDPAEIEVGVAHAVRDSWVANHCEFSGVFGACGLFRRTDQGAQETDAGLFDLVRYDSPRLQYLQRVRWPLGVAARRLIRRS
jgi:predicted O-methyltransferase YrrM